MSVARWEEHGQPRTWILKDVLLDSMAAGLYTGPFLDSVICTQTDRTVYLTSMGGDGGEIWGEHVTCAIIGGQFQVLHRESFFDNGEESRQSARIPLIGNQPLTSLTSVPIGALLPTLFKTSSHDTHGNLLVT